MRLNILGVTSELTSFPGCADIAVSHALNVPRDKRGNGLGKEAQHHRIAHMQQLGYMYVICTVQKDNEAQRAILDATGWKELDWFYSERTDHEVCIYGRYL